MGKQGFQPEQIIVKLRDVEILLGNGQSVQTPVSQIGVSEQTFYRKNQERPTGKNAEQYR